MRQPQKPAPDILEVGSVPALWPSWPSNLAPSIFDRGLRASLDAGPRRCIKGGQGNPRRSVGDKCRSLHSLSSICLVHGRQTGSNPSGRVVAVADFWLSQRPPGVHRAECAFLGQVESAVRELKSDPSRQANF